MKAVSPILTAAVLELQELENFKDFALGGGTNLAIRYHHRNSIDLDFFHPHIIGKAGFNKLQEEIKKRYPDSLVSWEYPCDIDDQYIFLRVLLKKSDTLIKIDLLQNFNTLDAPEIVNGMRLLTVKDIGLLKLMSAADRANNKDIYDLDHITDHVDLIPLYEALRDKKQKFGREEHKTIFELDSHENPLSNPGLLLKFEKPVGSDGLKHRHTHDRIDEMDGQKSWLQARSSWRRKLRRLYDHLNLPFPALKGTRLRP